MKLEGLIASVVHEVQASDARIEGLFSSVVHAVAADDARLEGLFGSVVHAIQAQDARLEGLIASVVHNDIPAPPASGGFRKLGKGCCVHSSLERR